MVKWLTLLLFVCFPYVVFPVDMQVQLKNHQVGEDQKIQGTIQVRVKEGEQIDEHSFHLEGKPLSVRPMSQSSHHSIQVINGRKIESRELITRYEFEIPGKKEGLHLLSPIAVAIDGEEHTSEQKTFEIKKSRSHPGFFIKTFVEGDSPIYPGQRLDFIYRVYVTAPFDLTNEELPMMYPEKGFDPIGDIEFRTFPEEHYQVQELRLHVQATDVGTFAFSPAILQGFYYEDRFLGGKRYTSARLEARGEEVTITVTPFPEEKQPASFEGALGEFEIDIQVISAREIFVGDRIELEVIFRGDGDLRSIRLPLFYEDPAFKKKFWLQEVPEEIIEEGQKKYRIPLRVLSDEVAEIPSFEFSSFDRRKDLFIRKQTPSIPLNIVKAPLVLKEEEKEEGSPTKKKKALKKKAVQKGSKVEKIAIQRGKEIKEEIPIEVIAIPKKIDIYSLKMGVSNALRAPLEFAPFAWIFLIGASLFIGGQLGLKRLYYYWREKWSIYAAEQLLVKGLADLSSENPQTFAQDLEKAFMIRLFERKQIPASNLSPELLSQEGEVGEVRDFILRLHQIHYGGKDAKALKVLKEEAEQLFKRL